MCGVMKCDLHVLPDPRLACPVQVYVLLDLISNLLVVLRRPLAGSQVQRFMIPH